MNNSNKTLKLDHIDSLRGVAILLVIMVHTSQNFDNLNFFIKKISEYGQFGVQLFFVLSAFTLCYTYEKTYLTQNYLYDFFIKRFFRIFPMYYFGILIYSLFNYFSNYPIFEENYSLLNILINVIFLNGFYYPANNNIVPGGWSIGTEMAFYLLFPILFVFIKKQINTNLKFLYLFIFIIILDFIIMLSIYIFTGKFIQNNNFLYFNLINQLSVFFFGFLIYYKLKNQIFKKYNLTINLLLYLILTFLIFILWDMNDTFMFILIPLLTGLSFLFLYKVFENNHYLNFRILRRIGELSYSMYILHFIFAWYFTDFIKNIFKNTIEPNIMYILLLLLSITLTYFLSNLTNKYIENIGTTIGRKIINSKKGIKN